MTDYISSNSMLMLERAMNFQWTKQETLLDNIVNADTPGYKAKYVTFEEALRDNLRRAQVGETPVSTMRGVLKAAQPTVRTAEDESFRMDENGVNVAEQQLELVRNAYQIQHVYNALNSDMQRLLMARRGQ